MKCQYEKNYYDYEIGDLNLFKCDENAVKNGLCIFHHPMYWKTHEDLVRNKFYKKVEKAIRNREKLICIGYNLPTIAIHKRKFAAPIYFVYTRFQGGTDFSETKFSKVSFLEARFQEEANFSESEFSEADFSRAKFSENVNFWKAKFLDKADFSGAEFCKEAYF
ncbi:MAG: pentapeptide repeat-containing protein [Candidatus Baldrarchaeia archaeon]